MGSGSGFRVRVRVRLVRDCEEKGEWGRVLRLGVRVGSGWKVQAHAARVEADGVLEARPLGHVPLRLLRMRVSVRVRVRRRALSSGASSRALPPARPGGPKIGRLAGSVGLFVATAARASAVSDSTPGV